MPVHGGPDVAPTSRCAAAVDVVERDPADGIGMIESKTAVDDVAQVALTGLGVYVVRAFQDADRRCCR